jgi:hypothetical protein
MLDQILSNFIGLGHPSNLASPGLIPHQHITIPESPLIDKKAKHRCITPRSLPSLGVESETHDENEEGHADLVAGANVCLHTVVD